MFLELSNQTINLDAIVRVVWRDKSADVYCESGMFTLKDEYDMLALRDAVSVKPVESESPLRSGLTELAE